MDNLPGLGPILALIFGASMAAVPAATEVSLPAWREKALWDEED